MNDPIPPIAMVGADMCEECDAFLGRPHAEGCSKHGRLVEHADATWKMTTVDHALEVEGTFSIGRHTEGQQLNIIRGASRESIYGIVYLLTAKAPEDTNRELVEGDERMEFEIGDFTFVVERETPDEDPNDPRKTHPQ